MCPILITGGSGFVGRHLIDELVPKYQIRATYRSKHQSLKGVEWQQVVDIGKFLEWDNCLQGVECVIHLAARAHKIRENNSSSQELYDRVNVQGTVNLANACIRNGVRKLIFISTIGVMGDRTTRAPLTEMSDLNPFSAYTRSKQKAELELLMLAKEHDIEIVIIRPPMVYGEGAPGNFKILLEGIYRRLPMPLGSVNNARSFVGIDNLVSLITKCINHPSASNNIFLAGDGEDISTTELVKTLGRLMGRPAILLPIHIGVLRCAATLIGRRSKLQSLLGTLQVDISKARTQLGWIPPYGLEKGLKKTVNAFLESKNPEVKPN